MLIIGLLMTALAGAQAASSTGRITGRIVDVVTGEPIPGATVSITPIPVPSAGRSISPPSPDPALLRSLTSHTNIDGMFEVGGVPSGRWSVQVNKDGYIPLSATTSSLAFDVGAGAVRVPDIRMDRGGAIVGRVLDARGRPMVRVGVLAMQQVRNRDGTVRLTGGASASTNDLGEFRLSGLAPGQYAVIAQPPPSVVNPFTGGSPTAAATAYVPTVYPGSSDIGQASSVAVSGGVTTSGIDFSMVSIAAYHVFGVVVDAGGRPVGGAVVRLVQARPPLPAAVHQGNPSALDGTFAIVNVPEGSYSAQAVIPLVTQRPGGVSASVSFGTPGNPGSVEVVVRGANVEGVRLVVASP